MRALKTYLWAIAVRKGFFGGQRYWMAVVAVVTAVKVFRRISGSTQDVVYCEELKAGQALVLTHHSDVRRGDKPGKT